MVSFRLGLGIYLGNFIGQVLERKEYAKIEENEWIFWRQKCANFAFYVMLNQNAQKVSIAEV